MEDVTPILAPDDPRRQIRCPKDDARDPDLTGHRLSLARIAEAAQSITPAFLGSPQLRCGPLSELAGCDVTWKIETINPIRSFKGRGADYFVAKAVEAGERGPLACASAGNFGHAMAYACRARGLA
ncbi:MAG: pyridoxal-phosphate dependent enzyme, partial [Myxococcales bacterium]|nr:pyridoxal-phosphate dependent enzyme [Myxococcales bacterium]